jgi:hypothetical protein
MISAELARSAARRTAKVSLSSRISMISMTSSRLISRTRRPCAAERRQDLRYRAVEGLMNRRSSDLEQARDGIFAQLLTRLEYTGDDAMLDRLIGLIL